MVRSLSSTKAGKNYIFQVETLADRDDLLRSGPWTINAALLLLRPWLPDVPLHRMDFFTADMWIQIMGVTLEYMTPTMAVRLGTLLGTVLSVDHHTVANPYPPSIGPWCFLSS